MTLGPHIHFVGIGGIGVSGLARHYHHLGYTVTGSDTVSSSITELLESQGISVYIGEQADFITEQTQKVIYTEGIVRNDEQHEQALDRHPETKKARNLGIETLSYPQGLAQVFNPCFGIAVTGTHGKSTTTSLLGLILQKSELPTSVLTGTNLTQFDETNYYTSGNKYFAIEACEHKRHFLNYYPNISIITNAEVDHLDYYKDEQDYLDAFTTFQSQTSDWIIYNGLDTNLKRIIDPRKNSIALLEDGNYTSNGPDAIDPGSIPKLNMSILGDHVLLDARLAFLAGKVLKIDENIIIQALESYTGAWRRMETVGKTPAGNLLMSDYGHHPTEIRVTLDALKKHFPKKHLYVIFQPHQYSRTIELLDDFCTCFDDADSLLIPDIYFSRDSKEDVAHMPVERFIDALKQRYPNTIHGGGLEQTKDIILKHDQKNTDTLYLLLGAGDVDNLRYDLNRA